MFERANFSITVLFLISLVSIRFSTSSVIPRDGTGVTSDSDDPSVSGLYYGFKKAVILNNTNFNNEIFTEHKDKLWLVEFYSHWCGYCIRFVPVMKAFASHVYEWRDVVVIGTVNCANSENNEICRNHEIKQVPTIKIFPPNSEENFVGLAFGKGSETTISEMIENLAVILKSYHNSQEKISGPVNLKLLRYNSLDRLWNEVPQTVVFVMLVFEPKDSLVGSQVALDVSRTPEVRLRLVDPKNKNLSRLVGMEEGGIGVIVLERNSQTLLNAQSSPSNQLIAINDLTQSNVNAATTREGEPNDIQQAHVVASEFISLPIENFTREGLNKAVRKFLISRGVNIAPELPKVSINSSTHISVDKIKEAIRKEGELKRALDIKHLSSVVFQMDLEAAVVYAFTGEVSLVRNITAERLDVLNNFVTVLSKYFPAGEQGKKFFTELKQKELDNKEFVCGEDIRKTVEELQEKHKPFMENLEWVGCRGTIPSLRGYPCGLWTLFHTLVALEELHDRNDPSEKPEALNATAGYIKHFFSCRVCSEHFTKMAKTIEGNVTSQRDAVLWLWRAHNNVNHRLAGDETEDPRHHKVQFPTVDMCPACHNANSWDEDQVFTFLSNMYTNTIDFDPHNIPTSTLPTILQPTKSA